MADKPILFSGPMVRALLAGTKTQTRRLLTLRGHKSFTEFGPSDTQGYDWHFRDAGMRWHDLRDAEMKARLRVSAGDRLYVREAWSADPNGVEKDGGIDIVYFADHHRSYLKPLDDWRLPKAAYSASGLITPLHMPRWASRITLHVTEVRVQRLQDVSEEDALAEGITPLPSGRYHCGHDEEGQITAKSSVTAFAWLWNSINGEDAWTQNPWVAAYTFQVERANIAQARTA